MTDHNFSEPSTKLPGTKRTAYQVIQDEGLVGQLTGSHVLITGSSSGIGIDIARALFDTGATLYLTARDFSKARSALGTILASGRVHLLHMDLESLESVRACATDFLSRSKELNILLCNAGTMTPEKTLTKDGLEEHFGVNHLAHFLLFNLLRPALIAGATSSRASRVVALSSIAHRWGIPKAEDIQFDIEYNGMLAYGASKTLQMWMCNEIERRWGREGIHTWSVNPGAIITELDRHMSPEDRAADRANPVKLSVMKTAKQGAASPVWAAVAAVLEGSGGGYVEDCQVSGPWEPSAGPVGPGYATHIMDEAAQGIWWDISERLVTANMP